MRYLFSILLIVIQISVFAQTFTSDDDVKRINKPTTASTPPHEYFQLINLSGDTLYLRWKINQQLTFYPTAWTLALQDRNFYHNPIIDSADIMLPDTAESIDKLIVNVYSNFTAGYGELVLDVFNLNPPYDSIQLKYEIDIFNPNDVAENAIEWIHFYPNPVRDNITFENPLEIEKIAVYSLNGEQVITQKLSNNSFSTATLPKGTYLLIIENKSGILHYSRLIKQ